MYLLWPNIDNYDEFIVFGWEQANFNRYLRCEMPDYII